MNIYVNLQPLQEHELAITGNMKAGEVFYGEIFASAEQQRQGVNGIKGVFIVANNNGVHSCTRLSDGLHNIWPYVTKFKTPFTLRLTE